METLLHHEIKTLKWTDRVFVKKGARGIPFDKLPEFLTESFKTIYTSLAEAKIKSTQPPCAIFYSVDEWKKEAHLAAAVPVEGKLSVLKKLEFVSIPECEVVTATHHGPYENMVSIYEALEHYVKEHHKEEKLIIEEYINRPETVKNPSELVTNIYFIVD
jgi:effector-binding domain-containing protein